MKAGIAKGGGRWGDIKTSVKAETDVVPSADSKRFQ